MNRLVVTLCSIGCLVGAAASQNYTVFPSDHTGTPPNNTVAGATYENYAPFSYGIARQMIYYDAWDVRIPNGRSISRIGFVCNETSSSTGYPLMLKVQMGQSTQPFANVSTTFNTNFTGTPTVVYGDASGNAKIFNLPDIAPLPTGPNVVWLPLDNPFPYDNTKNLVIDFQVFANQNSNAAFNYRLDEARHISTQRSFNLACPTSGGRTPSIVSNESSTYIGRNWYLNLSNGPSTTPMALLVGLQCHEPGIPLDPIGGTNCLLSIDPLWSGAYNTSSGGAANWSFPIPNNRDLFGGYLYAQAIMQDVFANSLGWITSNGDEIQLGIRPQAALIRGAQGNATAATGGVTYEFGLVTIFDHN